MPDTITPVTREEDYLAAIAGQDVTPPTPVTRKEEWLDLIADKVDGLAGDIEDLQDVVPTPAAADEGKVLTAGDDGTASWQTASGGSSMFQHYRSETLPLTASSEGTVYTDVDPALVPTVPAIVLNGPCYAWTCDSLSFGGDTYSRTDDKWQAIGSSHSFESDDPMRSTYYVYVDVTTQGSGYVWVIEGNDFPSGATVTFNGLDLAVSTTEDVAITRVSTPISGGSPTGND